MGQVRRLLLSTKLTMLKFCFCKCFESLQRFESELPFSDEIPSNLFDREEQGILRRLREIGESL